MSANKLTNTIIVLVVISFLAATCLAAVVRSSARVEKITSVTTAAIIPAVSTCRLSESG